MNITWRYIIHNGLQFVVIGFEQVGVEAGDFWGSSELVCTVCIAINNNAHDVIVISTDSIPIVLLPKYDKVQRMRE